MYLCHSAMDNASLWQLRLLSGHDRQVTNIAGHPNKPYFLSSATDGTFTVWDARVSSCVARVDAHISQFQSSRTNTAVFSADGDIIARYVASDGFLLHLTFFLQCRRRQDNMPLGRPWRPRAH